MPGKRLRTHRLVHCSWGQHPQDLNRPIHGDRLSDDDSLWCRRLHRQRSGAADSRGAIVGDREWSCSGDDPRDADSPWCSTGTGCNAGRWAGRQILRGYVICFSVPTGGRCGSCRQCALFSMDIARELVDCISLIWVASCRCDASNSMRLLQTVYL